MQRVDQLIHGVLDVLLLAVDDHLVVVLADLLELANDVAHPQELSDCQVLVVDPIVLEPVDDLRRRHDLAALDCLDQG